MSRNPNRLPADLRRWLEIDVQNRRAVLFKAAKGDRRWPGLAASITVARAEAMRAGIEADEARLAEEAAP